MHVKLRLTMGLLALLSVPAGLTLADNGPHGGYTATTDACAGCHRTHTAAAAKLTIGAVPGLCYTCHGSTGTGADTNVADGIYLERDGVTELPAECNANRGLKGGGFANALMDSNWDESAAAAPVTSSHLVNGGTGTAWGNGALGSGAGAAIPLSCVSCHDPHGRAGTGGVATYRLLRAIPVNSGASGGVDVSDQANKCYVVSNPDQQYFGENYTTRTQPLAKWCSQCHTRYLAAKGSENTPSGDPMFAYRHRSDGASFLVGCMSCHVAHGTSAQMGGFAGTVPWPDGSTAPAGDGRSALLRLDNRGVCQQCHGM